MSRGSNRSKTFETTLIESMRNLRTFILEDYKMILENLTDALQESVSRSLVRRRRTKRHRAGSTGLATSATSSSSTSIVVSYALLYSTTDVPIA
jgi:hypothetical protein